MNAVMNRGTSLPDINERAWELIVRIAANCKGCPCRATTRCSTCDCSTAAALIKERDVSKSVMSASFNGRGRKGAVDTHNRRREGLAMIPLQFVKPSEINYTPWMVDAKARANDLKLLRKSGAVEARIINSKVVLYRRPSK